jgi:uncharacterized protein
MIQEFSLKNFLSFYDKQTISFLASKDKKLLDELTYEPRKGVKLLKLLMIYGSNASGKSNLLIAINTLWDMLISPEDKENEKIQFFNPFILKNNESTEFEIIFWIKDRKYKYEIEYNQDVILYERMEYLSDSGIMSVLYEREFGKEIKFGSTIEIKSKEKNDFNLNTLKNHTVLSTLNKKNINAPKIMKELYDWIKNNDHEINAFNDPLEIVDFATKNNKIKLFLLEILNKADFNIIDFKIIESKLNEKLIERIKDDKDIPEKIKSDILKPQKQIIFTHNNDIEDFQIEFGMESKGTKRYFRLARLLLELGNDSVVILEDELEDSLHYDLLIHFLETFLKMDKNKNSQLIFTTHNQMILDENWFLRRDMVCFIEKSRKKSNSEIYKVSDMGLHKNLSILNAYKIGKLGAKPILGSTLIDEL